MKSRHPRHHHHRRCYRRSPRLERTRLERTTTRAFRSFRDARETMDVAGNARARLGTNERIERESNANRTTTRRGDMPSLCATIDASEGTGSCARGRGREREDDDATRRARKVRDDDDHHHHHHRHRNLASTTTTRPPVDDATRTTLDRRYNFHRLYTEDERDEDVRWESEFYGYDPEKTDPFLRRITS